MLTVLPLAHTGAPVAPHDLWTSWSADPLVVVGLLTAVVLYARGRTPRTEAWRARCFAGALLALAVALLSPLDALSASLASAHMVQHLLLVLVAAPLLALSAPSSVLLRGGPAAVREAVTPWRRRVRVADAVSHALRRPVVVWLLAVATLWLWHAAALYDAALAHPVVHALEHGTFLLTAVLFWRVVVGTRAVRVPAGLGILLLFTMTLQGSLLSLLLTFAGAPFYDGYATTTQAWGLDQLGDQHLAGAIMWVPAGFVYLGTALVLLVGWVRGTEDPDDVPTTGDVPVVPQHAGGRT